MALEKVLFNLFDTFHMKTYQVAYTLACVALSASSVDLLFGVGCAICAGLKSIGYSAIKLN